MRETNFFCENDEVGNTISWVKVNISLYWLFSFKYDCKIPMISCFSTSFIDKRNHSEGL